MSDELRKRIAELEAALETKDPEGHFKQLLEANEESRSQIATLTAQLAGCESVKEFARKVIISKLWGNGAEAFDIQDIAEKLGLIVLTTATEEYVSEYTDFEVGDSIYKFSEILKEQDNG